MLATIRYSQGIQDAWSKIATFVPKFLGFLIILIVGYFVVKAIAKIADAALERVGFDKAVERGGVKKALESSKYDASDLLSKIIFYGLFLIVLQLAFGVFGANPVSDMLAGVVAYLPKVIAALIIVVLAMAIAAAVREVITASLGNLSYGQTLATAAGLTIIAVGFFAALSELKIAPAIVNGLFYALIATAAGVTIIAVGGGGIQPMQERWKNVLTKYDDEKPNIQREMESARPRIEGRARELKQKAQAQTQAGGASSSGRSNTGGN
jgi:hypothetical protein